MVGGMIGRAVRAELRTEAGGRRLILAAGHSRPRRIVLTTLRQAGAPSLDLPMLACLLPAESSRFACGFPHASLPGPAFMRRRNTGGAGVSQEAAGRSRRSGGKFAGFVTDWTAAYTGRGKGSGLPNGVAPSPFYVAQAFTPGEPAPKKKFHQPRSRGLPRFSRLPPLKG